MTTTTTPSLAEEMLAQARRLLGHNRNRPTASDLALAEVYLDAAEVARQYPGGAEDVLAAAAALRMAEDRPHSSDQDRYIAAARLRLRIAAASHAARQAPEDPALPDPKPARRYRGTPTVRD